MVKIKGTGTIFDGMTGEIESEDGDKITVMLNFDDRHKVRNTFKRENVEGASETTDVSAPVETDIEVDNKVDEDIEPALPVLPEDKHIIALATLLDIPPEYIEEGSGKHEYNVADDEEEHGGEEWLVYSDDEYSEAEEEAEDSVRSLIDDIGPVDYFGIDHVMYYLDEEYFDDYMREDFEDLVWNMSDEELLDELEEYGIIDEDDKIPDPDWEADPDNPDDEPEMIYPMSLVTDDNREALIDKKVDVEGDSIDWYVNVFGKSDLSEFIKNNENCVDMDRLLRDMYIDVAGELARCDGQERYISIEDEEDGSSKGYYLYRVD